MQEDLVALDLAGDELEAPHVGAVESGAVDERWRVAETLAEVALKNPLIDHVTISVRKRPPVQGLEWAGVQITRNRADSTSATS